MRGVNKVILVGTLGKDPETRTFEKGSIVSFSLATNDGYKDKNGNKVERTEWHNISISAPGLVDVAQKYLKKGDHVYLEGKIQSREYETKEQPGIKRRFYEIRVSSISLLGGKPEGGKVSEPEMHYEEDPSLDELPF